MGIKDFFKKLFTDNYQDKPTKVESEISSVSYYANNMLKNDELLNTLKKFILKTSEKGDFPSMFYLELSFVPYNYYETSKKFLLKYSKISGTSPYYKILSKYHDDFLQESYGYTKATFYLKNQDYDNNYLKNEHHINQVPKFEILSELYNTLMNDNLIEDTYDIRQYHAFLFVIYYLRNKYISSIGEDMIDEYNIDIEEDEESIIESLYNLDCPEDEIWYPLYAKRNIENDFCVVYSMENEEIDEIIKKKIKILKTSDKISNILNTGFDEDDDSISIDDIDLMTGEQFEEFVVDLFSAMNYKTTHTKLSGDQGIDVIAEKGNSKVAIQAKCYTGTVGNHAIMEAVAGAKHYGATKCMVVTNSTFTKSAKELAESNKVVLWDRKILKEKINQYM